MLSRLLKEEKGKAPVPEKPELPKGVEWDLTSTDLKLPNGVKFEIPDALQVPKDDKAVVSPASMTPEQWIFVARNSCMLYGRRMDGVEPTTAAYPVLHWKVPSSNNFVRSEHLAAEVKSELTYTETSSNYVRQGFLKADATLRVPFCSASVEREHNEKTATSTKTKQLFMTGIWHYPRARVLLEECSVVSPQFVEEIRVALGLEPDPYPKIGEMRKEMGLDDDLKPKEEQQQEWEPMDADEALARKMQEEEQLRQVKLQAEMKQQQAQLKAAKKAIAAVENVLRRYGHVIGWSVDLGGRLFFVHHKQSTGNVNTHEEKSTTKAAVGIKTTAPIEVQAQVGIAIGKGEANADEAYQIAETTSFTALGGDTILASNPQAWSSTVKDPNLWAVIGIAESKSTVDLLPEPLRAFLKQLWNKYGKLGHLDGCTMMLKSYQHFTEPYLMFTRIGPVQSPTATFMRSPEFSSYAKPSAWKIICFRDDLYWIVDEKSQCVMDPDAIDSGAFEIELWKADKKLSDPRRAWKAAWHIHPVDPDRTYGDQFRDCYLLESIWNGCLLIPSSVPTLQSGTTFVRLPLAEFSVEATYIQGNECLKETKIKADGIWPANSVSATQLIWKFEWVEEE